MNSIPADVVAALDAVDSALDRVEEAAKPLLERPLSATRADLTAIESAKLDLGIAYAVNSLFWVYLSAQGVSPRDHAVKAELDRIRDCMKRVRDVETSSGAASASGAGPAEDAAEPEGKKAKLNMAAAKRFIDSALPGDAPAAAAADGDGSAAAAADNDGGNPRPKKKSKKSKGADGGAASPAEGDGGKKKKKAKLSKQKKRSKKEPSE